MAVGLDVTVRPAQELLHTFILDNNLGPASAYRALKRPTLKE